MSPVLHRCVGDAASVVAYFKKRGILALSDIHRPDCDVGGLRFFPCRAQNYATVGCAGRAGISKSSYVPRRVLCRAEKFNAGGRARLMKAVARPVSRLRCVVVYYGDGCYVQEGGFYSVDDIARFPRYRQVCAVVENPVRLRRVHLRPFGGRGVCGVGRAPIGGFEKVDFIVGLGGPGPYIICVVGGSGKRGRHG